MTPACANSGQAAKRPVAATCAVDAAPIGGRSGRLSFTLATHESAGVPAPVRRIRRSRQIDPKNPWLWEEDGVGAPFDRRAPQTREGLGLRAGALLVREWNGRLERVMIVDEASLGTVRPSAAASRVKETCARKGMDYARCF